MKVCDVVLNSIWYDPRVRKQLTEYKANNIDVTAVGMKCQRYDEKKTKLIPCSADIVQIDEKFDGQQKGLLRKLKREKLRFKAVVAAIVRCKPDIIHANDLNALIPAYHAAKKLKCKIIYDSHEINVENYTTNGKSKIAGLMRAIEKYIVKRVDLMVCVSNAAADYFHAEYGIKRPLVVTNCSLKKEITACSYSDKHSGFEILNHGQFYAGRGYEQMLDAATLLKEEYTDIKICVRGFGRLENEMRKRAEENNLNNFIFYPPVNVEQLIIEASRSHVGVAITEPICLNFKLSVSNKLFEYAAAGLPVIMSDIPEHRYLNNKYDFGLIIPENTPEAIAEAARKLYNDKLLYNRLSENSVRMSKELNWENEFYKLVEAEKQLLNK